MSGLQLRVSWDGHPVAGVTRIGALSRETQVIEHLDGAGSGPLRTSPGRTTHQPVTLERGVGQDDDFAHWADAVLDPGGSAELRRDVLVELVDEAGSIVLAVTLRRAWVSAYSVVGGVSPGDAAPPVESITLQHQGWERHVGTV